MGKASDIEAVRPRRMPAPSIRKHQRLAAGFLADSFRQFPHGFRNLAGPQNLDIDTARAARARALRTPGGREAEPADCQHGIEGILPRRFHFERTAHRQLFHRLRKPRLQDRITILTATLRLPRRRGRNPQRIGVRPLRSIPLRTQPKAVVPPGERVTGIRIRRALTAPTRGALAWKMPPRSSPTANHGRRGACAPATSWKSRAGRPSGSAAPPA